MHSLISVMKSGAPEQIKYGVRCLKACNNRYKDLAVEIVEVKSIISVSYLKENP